MSLRIYANVSQAGHLAAATDGTPYMHVSAYGSIGNEALTRRL